MLCTQQQRPRTTASTATLSSLSCVSETASPSASFRQKRKSTLNAVRAISRAISSVGGRDLALEPPDAPAGAEPLESAAPSTEDPSLLEVERWHLLSVIDELWTNRTVRRLDLTEASPALAGVVLTELCRALGASPCLKMLQA